MKQKVFSGVQPTGNLHIGNYLGAIKRWVKSQEEYDNIFCVVDLHAITVLQDPKVLNSKIREVTGLFLAAGINQEQSTLFVQSHIGAHSELAWILNCFLPMGWMQRMTQFKEKSEKYKSKVSVGLFDYPALMAADILLYDTDVVPVGEDQKQHIELTQSLAERFNYLYKEEVFKIPKPMIAKTGARIMGLDDATKKMSKSEDALGHAIYLLDSPDEIKKKIQKSKTDSSSEIVFDENRPEIYNLLSIYQVFTEKNKEEIEDEFKTKNYGQFKKELAEVVVEGLKPLQEKYKEIANEPGYIDSVLKEGAERLKPIANKKLKEVQSKIGLG